MIDTFLKVTSKKKIAFYQLIALISANSRYNLGCIRFPRTPRRVQHSCRVSERCGRILDVSAKTPFFLCFYANFYLCDQFGFVESNRDFVGVVFERNAVRIVWIALAEIVVVWICSIE